MYSEKLSGKSGKWLAENDTLNFYFPAEKLLGEGQGTIGMVERQFQCFQLKAPPDCWRKTRIVRVGGPLWGPF
jgi:hypothetical protein